MAQGNAGSSRLPCAQRPIQNPAGTGTCAHLAHVPRVCQPQGRGTQASLGHGLTPGPEPAMRKRLAGEDLKKILMSAKMGSSRAPAVPTGRLCRHQLTAVLGSP